MRWKPIPNFSGYEISETGLVRSLPRKAVNGMTVKGRIRKPSIHPRGYVYYVLTRDGKMHTKKAHRLVWEAFVGPIDSSTHINHMDFNRANNSLSNLEACTALYNHKYSHEAGRYRMATKHLTDLDVEIIRKSKRSKRMISRLFNISNRVIQRIKNKNNLKYMGNNNILKDIVAALAVALIASCSSVHVQTVPEKTETPVQEEPSKAQPCAKGTWCAVWTDTVRAKLTPAILAANVSSFCPNASSIDRKEVWVAIVKSIAYAESGWDPNNRYVETAMGTDPITGKQVASEGLLQLSCQDVVATAYKNLPTAALIDCRAHPGAILDPVTNLRFGLEIMDVRAAKNPSRDISSRLKTDGYSSLGDYWSSVWKSKTSARKKMKAIMPGCGL